MSEPLISSSSSDLEVLLDTVNEEHESEKQAFNIALLPPPTEQHHPKNNDDDVFPGFNMAQAIALSSWLLVLFLGWLLTKLICSSCNIPSNCSPGFGSMGAMEDLQMLVLYGFALSYMVGLLSPQRHAYVFCRERWWFFPVLWGSGPIWSLLHEVPIFQGSLAPGTSGATLVILIFAALFCLITVVGWHIRYTWKKCTKQNAILYTISRMSVLVFYAITVIIGTIPATSRATFHLHHYLVAYSLALFATYNHWKSLCMLAIASGVFVQGLGAYNYASFFTAEDHCVYWSMNDQGGGYAPTDFIAFTTRTTPHKGVREFRLLSCLVDENGQPDLRGKGSFGEEGIRMIVSPNTKNDDDHKNVTNSTMCYSDLFPKDGECSSGFFTGT